MGISKHASASSLFALCQVSKLLYAASIQELYKMIRIGPKIKVDVWRRLIDMLESPEGAVYCGYIKNMNELWLYVGGEESQQDSAVALDVHLAPKYSLHRVLEFLMLKCPLRSFQLQFYSERLTELPWSAVNSLCTLKLSLRVTDCILAKILVASISLQTLILTRAELSDCSLYLISHNCRRLKHLILYIVPVNERSRYYMSVDPQTALEITDCGLSKLKILNLTKMHIRPLFNISPNIYEEFNSDLQEISLTLSSRAGMTIEACCDVIKRYHSTINVVNIFGNKQETNEVSTLSDRCIAEEIIMDIPNELPKLKKLNFKHLDLSKIEACNFRMYYGGIQSSWQLDAFHQIFFKRYPNIELKIEYD